MRLGLSTVLLMALFAAGCSSDVNLEPSPAELQAQWDAQNVYPAHYKEDLLAFLRSYLNNPEHIRDAAVSAPQLKAVGPGQRYVACVRYNARDDQGHYAGAKVSAVVYVSGKLDQFIDRPKPAHELCKDAALAPFLELAKLAR